MGIMPSHDVRQNRTVCAITFVQKQAEKRSERVFQTLCVFFPHIYHTTAHAEKPVAINLRTGSRIYSVSGINRQFTYSCAWMGFGVMGEENRRTKDTVFLESSLTLGTEEV